MTKNSLSLAEMEKMGYPELREAIWRGLSEQNRQALAERHGVNLEQGLTLLAMDYMEGARLSGLPEDEQYVTFDEYVTYYLED